MSSSHDFAIARLGGLESGKAFHRTVTERDVELLPAWKDAHGRVWPARWSPACQGHECRERPLYVTRYRYVTGRSGRTTDRVQYACAAHGEAFARKHGLALPAEAAA